MKTMNMFGLIVLVTFFATNLYAAEIAVKAAPTLTVKEPAATTMTVKEPTAAPTIVAPTTTVAPTIKLPTTSITVKDPALAPAIKEPTLAVPAVKVPTAPVTVKEPVVAPTIKTPSLAPNIREPVVQAPSSLPLKEPTAGLKDPSLMGVRGEQMMDSGKLDNLGVKGVDALGSKGVELGGPGVGLRPGVDLPGGAAGVKGMELSDPASALRAGRPGAATDRNSLDSQFGLGGTQNPKGTPERGSWAADSRLMEGGGDEGKKENWHMVSEMNDYEDSNGNLVIESRTTGTNLDTGETIEETVIHRDGASETHVVIKDAAGNVVADETFTEDVEDTGDDAKSTPDPEGEGGPLPPEMEAMLQQMQQYKRDLKANPQDTLTNPGDGGYSAAKGSPKGGLSAEGRLNPYINPGPDGGDGPVASGGEVPMEDVRGSLINPGNAGVEVSPKVNKDQPPGQPSGGGAPQTGVP